jgi:hypothetical protein
MAVTIENIDKPIINGRFLTPELVALAPLIAWNHRGSCSNIQSVIIHVARTKHTYIVDQDEERSVDQNSVDHCTPHVTVLDDSRWYSRSVLFPILNVDPDAKAHPK